MKKVTALSLAAGLIFASSFQAQAESLTDGFYVKANTGYISEQKNENASAEKLETTKAGIEVGTNYIDFGFENTNYKFKQDWGVPTLRSNFDAKKIYLDGKYFDAINSDWSYFVSFGVGANYVSGGIKFSKNYQYRIAAVANYTINSNWSVDLGAAGVYNKVGFQGLPVINFKYGNERDPGFSFKVGMPSNEVTYRFNDIFSVTSKLGAVDDVYGTSDNVFGHGYVRDTYYTVNASVKAEVNGLYGEAGVGYVFDRKLRTYDSHGDKIGDKAEFENEPVLYLNVGYNF